MSPLLAIFPVQTIILSRLMSSFLPRTCILSHLQVSLRERSNYKTWIGWWQSPLKDQDKGVSLSFLWAFVCADCHSGYPLAPASSYRSQSPLRKLLLLSHQPWPVSNLPMLLSSSHLFLRHCMRGSLPRTSSSGHSARSWWVCGPGHEVIGLNRTSNIQ